MSSDLDSPSDDLDPPPPPRPRPQPNFWWSLLACVGIFVVQTVGMLAVWLVVWLAWCAIDGDIRLNVDEDLKGLQQAISPPQADGTPPTLMSQRMAVGLTAGLLGANVAMFLYVWLLTRLVFGRAWPRVVALRRPGLAQLLVAWLIFLPGLMYADEGLDYLLRAVTGLRNDNYDLMSAALVASPLWLGLLAVALGPGVVEEFFCRGFVGRGLVGRHGWILGVFLTSLLFGLLHVEPVHAFITLLMGVGLHFTLATSRSLWVPILLHATNNAAWVVFSVVPGAAVAPTPVMLALRYSSAAVLLVLGVWALWSCRARVESMGDYAEVWKPRFPTVAVPPPESGLTTVEGRPNPIPLLLAPLPLGGLVLSFFAL